MVRTGLRLAALALLTNGGLEPWPTLAKDYVYDSRRDDLDSVQERMRRPVIVIRTDDDIRDYRSSGNLVSPMQSRFIDLLLELSVVTASKDDNGWVIGWPETDNTLEAVLDMLELQVENCLRGNSVWSMWWKNLRCPIMGFSSRPEFMREKSNVRLAARTITVSIQAPPECLPGWRFEHAAAKEAQPPEFLQRIFEKIDADGHGDLLIASQQMRGILAARDWPVEAPHPQLLRVRQTTVMGGESFVADQLARPMSLDFSKPDNSGYIPLIFED